MKTYREQYQLIASALRSLRPFDSDERREEEFEQLFDGVEVLPRCFERQYIEHMANEEFIEASRLFVSISHRKYQQLAKQGKIRPMEDTTRKRWVVLQEYSSKLGLLLDASPDELIDES